MALLPMNIVAYGQILTYKSPYSFGVQAYWGGLAVRVVLGAIIPGYAHMKNTMPARLVTFISYLDTTFNTRAHLVPKLKLQILWE